MSTSSLSGRLVISTNSTRPRLVVSDMNSLIRPITRELVPQEQAAAHEQHIAATPAQTQQEHTASTNKALLASQNHGKPAIAATAKPGEFTGKGVVAAREVTPSHTLPSVKPAGAAAIDIPDKETRDGEGQAEDVEAEHPKKRLGDA